MGNSGDGDGAYVGNPTAFNALGSEHVSQMLGALGVRRSFSSGTQDCANKFVAAEYHGTNPNVLLPPGVGSYEPLSSQAHMTGIPVTVEPLDVTV
jgi:hypothetical protein